jgi:hypothetical protein
MIRHLIPRLEWGGWTGSALTADPDGGQELPPGLTRSMRLAAGLPTRTTEYDEVEGGILTVQWLGLMVEIGIGAVR